MSSESTERGTDTSAESISAYPTGYMPPLRGLVHVMDIGDLLLYENAWAGTKGQSRRLEGFQISFSPPVEGLSMEYMAHLKDQGNTPWMAEGTFCGTRGQSLRAEGIAIRLTGRRDRDFDVFYQVHMADKGDSDICKNGEYCGTQGQSRRIEAMKVWVVAR